VIVRRAFLKALSVVPIAPGALASAPASAAPPSPAAAAPTGRDAVAAALTEAARAEHGGHLDAKELEAVRKEIGRSLDAAARLRADVRLGNGDEPVTLFAARPPAGAALPRGGRR
jgi:hypothetical protein